MTTREIATATTYQLQQRLGDLRHMDSCGIRGERFTREIFAIDDEIARRIKAA